MELHEALYTTRAMRRVKPDPIPDEVVARIMDAAIRAPSGGNQQRWRFVLVTSPETKATLAGWYREGLTELNRTQYKAVMDLIEHGDPDDPTVRQAKAHVRVGQLAGRQLRPGAAAPVRLRQAQR